MTTAGPIEVYLERGRTHVFACAFDWPGWCRRAKTDEAALDALAGYLPRYGPVVERAGLRLPRGAGEAFSVIETIEAPAGKSFSGPDFGTLAKPCARDSEPLTAAQAKRLAAILEASWAVFDEVVARAPSELRKGPRGGGRDRDKIVEHVIGAETAYARKFGVRHKQPAFGDTAALAAVRADIAAALRAARGFGPAGEAGWLPRYTVRRLTWHVLDHAWEIEDRAE